MYVPIELAVPVVENGLDEGDLDDYNLLTKNTIVSQLRLHL